MLSSTSLGRAGVCHPSHSRPRGNVRALCQQGSDAKGPQRGSTSRRDALALLAVPLLMPAPAVAAFGVDPRQALRDSSARKKQLKEAAKKMREKGVAEEAFKDSSYSLPEESRTPNMRNLSDEVVPKN
ncbi:hypothetical protein ACKKBF_B36090 [Auxenochlorella protothecoides x Auxenochlorella symbiontica]|uniref:Uncharacterized protein n=1 Tax=Auxenochlorella protothecoides TaxID=3075 RepID=A0A1D1ZXW7_AUXPR